MTMIKKGAETDKKKCPECEQPIILLSTTNLVAPLTDKCPWCNKMLHIKNTRDIRVK